MGDSSRTARPDALTTRTYQISAILQRQQQYPNGHFQFIYVRKRSDALLHSEHYTI
jgi:hypothetical protein